MEKVRMGAMPVGGEEGLRRSSRLRNRFSGFPSRSELGTSPVSVPTAEKPLTENTLVRPEVRWTSSGGDEDEVDMGPRSEEENGMVDYGDLDSQTSFTAFPPTYLVLRLSPNIQPAAVSWLVRKITGKKGEGGAELLVRCEPYGGRKKESLVLHVSASKLKFLELAEYMELKKVDCQGQLREFTVGDLDNFLHSDINLDNLLTAAEKQMIVIHELENLRSIAGESCVPGCPSLSIFVGQSIFQTFLTESLITSYYPLHDDAELTSLGDKWYWAFFQAQPFEEIRKYFGESISLYFSFLGFYTASLCAPAMLGILHLFFPDSASNYSLIFFCIFNVVWVTVTLELWKRKCSELAYVWGTLRMTKWEDPRSNFRGKMSMDPVTGRYQPKYPWWKTAVKVYGVSFPIVLVCLFGAFYIMLYSFWIEEILVEMQHENGSKLAAILVYVPSIVYAILVYLMNFYYRQLASFLTEWENHRTQSQFERHRVTKLVLFEFVNNFMSLFYIAFYLQDFEMLKYQVFVMLIILQAISHFQEAILPLLIRKAYTSGVQFLIRKYPKLAKIMTDEDEVLKGSKENNNASTEDSIWNPASLGLQTLDATDPRIDKSKAEGEQDPYEGTFDDYLEMFIQFGYVFLFSSVYPLAASWAIFNNVLEIRADAFKLCKVFQRPIAKRTKDIGAWQIAFEVMGAVAIMTNCGLLCLSPELRALSPTLRPAEWLLLFVVIEHCLLALTLALRQLIPDVPYQVKMAMARLEYQSRQALKNEQTFKSRRQLTRRFKTIHGPRTAASSPKATDSPGTTSIGSSSPIARRRVAASGKNL
ncbi:anoctamin-10 isoform X1 [Folsomia candida]|uniref:anoctamin-10 isoform X1 n=2 Tax=Folsomia candida TaxID=158441 RepID=UPI000B900BA8|nr:anoctamin-10 isoform X1 [Folsomia candida]